MNEGEADAVSKAMEQLPAFAQADSGLLRTIVMQQQQDAVRVVVLVVFESEEKARDRENAARRREGVQALSTSLAEVLQAAPEYTDVSVIADLVS